MTGKEIPFMLLRLQVKAPRTGTWIDIWPAQFEQFQKLGCEIRIIESSPGDQEMAEIDAWIASLTGGHRIPPEAINLAREWLASTEADSATQSIIDTIDEALELAMEVSLAQKETKDDNQ